jgi:transposase InsO family protein
MEKKIEVVHIQPGKPTQNVRVESFHGRLRKECLNVSWFQNLFDAKREIAAWRTEYNEERPHSSLGYLTPKEYAARETMKRRSPKISRLGKTLKNAFPTFPQLRWRLLMTKFNLLVVLSLERKLGAGHRIAHL